MGTYRSTDGIHGIRRKTWHAVSMAKAMGGGMPIGACCATKESRRGIWQQEHTVLLMADIAVACAAAHGS